MKLGIYKSIVILTIALVFQGYADSVRDSLKNRIAITEDAITKVKLLNELSKTYENKDFDESIKLATEALRIAKWADYKPGIIDSYNAIGYAYFFTGNYSSSLENYFWAERYLKKTKEYLKLAKTYRNIALIYKYLESPAHSIKFAGLCLRYLKNKPDNDLLIDCYYDLASAYRQLQDHKTEIYFLQKAIDIRLKGKQWNKIGQEYNSMGIAYLKLKDYENALKYFTLYRDFSIKCNDSLRIAKANNNLGIVFFSQNQYEKSLEFYQAALQLKQRNISYTYLGLVNSYCKLNNLKKAEHYFKLAQNAQPDLDELLSSCSMLAAACRADQKPKKAYYYQDLTNSLNEEIKTSMKREVELSSEMKYQVFGLEDKVNEKANYELLEENLRLQSNQNRLLFIILILVVGITCFVIFIYRKKLLAEKGKIKNVRNELVQLGKCINELKDFKKASY